MDLVFIRLVQTPGGYARHFSDSISLIYWNDALKLQRGQRHEIYISKTLTPTISKSPTMRFLRGFYVEIHNQTRNRCKLVRKFPDHLWNIRKGCFMIGVNEEFTSLPELSVSDSFHPKVLIVIDTNASEGKPQLWAAILPNCGRNDIADWPLEGMFDIV
jgi:hypothetical protein